MPSPVQETDVREDTRDRIACEDKEDAILGTHEITTREPRGTMRLTPGCITSSYTIRGNSGVAWGSLVFLKLRKMCREAFEEEWKWDTRLSLKEASGNPRIPWRYS